MPLRLTTFPTSLDGSNKRKILDIIDHQFDLEIYLKHREVATIQKEIENAHATLQDLEQAIKNGKKGLASQ